MQPFAVVHADQPQSHSLDVTETNALLCKEPWSGGTQKLSCLAFADIHGNISAVNMPHTK